MALPSPRSPLHGRQRFGILGNLAKVALDLASSGTGILAPLRLVWVVGVEECLRERRG